jgi:hypothetical protein
MINFRKILKETENIDLKVEDYKLSDENKDIPWFKDPKAKHDMFLRSKEADEIYRNTLSNDAEVITSDGYKIHFTTKGRREFFDSFRTAFFSKDRKAAAYETMQKNWPLANELIKTVDVLGELVKKSKLEYKNKNYKKEQKPDIDHYETFFTPVTINGKIRQMRIKVAYKLVPDGEGNTKGKRNYYYHWLQENQNSIIPIITKFEFLD